MLTQLQCLQCEVSRIVGDEHYYVCDKEEHYNYGHKFHCNITITQELALKNLKFTSSYHTPTVLNCIQCHMERIIPSIFDFELLVTVNLSRSHIKSLSASDISGNRLRTINLQYNLIEKLGEPLIFAKAANLKNIQLAHNLIKFINVNAFAGLGELEYLQLSFNQIEILNPMIFIIQTKLKVLELQNNAIHTIQLGVFQKNIQLHELILRNNLIESIADNAFDNLKQLTIFDASNNSIFGGHDQVWVSAKIVNLRKVNISECTVDEMVELFDASDNYLTNINLSVAEHLIEINLSKNVLKHIEFSNNYNLQVVDLSYNGLESISFVNVPKILQLNLTQNNLTNLKNLTHLKTLLDLDLSFNPITAIDLFVFADLEMLQVLTLRNIGLKYIQFGTFSYQHHLQRLDISYNNFSHLDLRVFYSINSLREFYINGNNLKQLHVLEIRDHFPQLERISISDNPWHCNDLTEIIRDLSDMNIVLSVNAPHKNRQNVRGIACDANEQIGLKNSSEVTTKLHKVYSRHGTGSDVDNVDQKLNNLKQYFDEKLKILGLSIQHLNATMIQDRAFYSENIHITNNIFNERINERFDSTMEKLQNLTKRFNRFVLLMTMDNGEDLENSSDKNLIK